MALLIRDLKPALANVLGTIKNVNKLPILEAAKVVVGGGKIKFLATDRFAAIEHEIAYHADAEFSYILDAESLQLLAKLPPMQQVDFTPDGVVAKNIKFTPADVDFPETVGDLLEKAHLFRFFDRLMANATESVNRITTITHRRGACMV